MPADAGAIGYVALAAIASVFIAGPPERNTALACTTAKETVAPGRLAEQLETLRTEKGSAAFRAAELMLRDEEEHRDAAVMEGRNDIYCRPLYRFVAASAEFVIWLGMKL